MFSSAEVAQQAALLHKSSLEAVRSQANLYLCAFQESAEAWGICRELIAPSTEEIPMLFACQVLYTKIKADWYKLDDGQKEELRQYVDSLLGQALTPTAIKKVCQCYALIGMLMMTTSWDQFIPYVLQHKPSEVSLEIMDCVPYCLNEFCMAKQSSARIKALIVEHTEGLLSFFNALITSKGYLWQVLEVLKGWRVLKLEILSHSGLTQTLLRALSDLDNTQYPSVCRVLLDAVSNCSSVYILSGKLSLQAGMSLQDVLDKFPSYERDSVLALAQVLIQVYPGILSSQDYEVRQAGVELILGFMTCNQLFFIWNEPVSLSLWQILDAIIGHSALEVAFNGLEFWYEFKDLLYQVLSKQHTPDFIHRPWLFEHIIRHSGLIAQKAQYTSYEAFFASIKEGSEVSLGNYRANTEDLFNSFFILFDKYHPQKGLAYLQIIGQLLDKPVTVSRAEVFVLAVRSLVLSLVDTQAKGALREVRAN
jgi:hypothetical protein